MATKGFFRAAYDMFRPVTATTVVNAPVAPAATTPPATTKTVESDPLETLAGVWKTDTTKTAPVDPLAGPILNTDTAKLREAISKVDLIAGVDPALLKRVQEGNDPAALIELMSAVSQNTLATAAQLSAATTEQGLQRQTQRIVAALPGRIKQQAIDNMPATNPALQHPASQPFLQMTRAQIAAQNPNLTPAEINARAESALLGYAQALNSSAEDAGFREGGLAQPNQGGAQKETDWLAWGGVSDK